MSQRKKSTKANPASLFDRAKQSFAGAGAPSPAHPDAESTNVVRIANVDLNKAELGSLCQALIVPPEEWKRRTELIKDEVLRRSKYLSIPNFRTIHTADIVHVADMYEELFFNRKCLTTARHFGLRFRLSSRMTSAGGKTTRYVFPATLTRPSRTEYEIAISTSLLFQTFQDNGNPVKVCGHLCSTRLDALLRIMEHELIHLSEMLAWYNSDCAATRFQNIAYRMFHHTEHRHELTTQQERAKQVYNIRVGSHVEFLMEGRRYQGLVNRITRRATVLVESPEGMLFSDGKRYAKFYVPLPMLKLVNRSA